MKFRYFHNITIFVADFIFAWGGRRGITGTVNHKKPPSPPTITVENFYFYMFALLTVEFEESSCLVSRSRGCGFEPVHRYCVVYLSKILYLHFLVMVHPSKARPDKAVRLWTRM